jgi:uncharacterized protein YcfJ
MKKFLMFFTLALLCISTANFAQTTHRKWSNRAKGAAIGGGAGAIAGGLIGHGVGGALIGGAIGAGGGYIIGDAKDRKKLRQRQAYNRAHRTHTRTYTNSAYVKPKTVTTTTKTISYQ